MLVFVLESFSNSFVGLLLVNMQLAHLASPAECFYSLYFLLMGVSVSLNC